MTGYGCFDVSRAETSVCPPDAGGKVRSERKVKSRPGDLIDCVREHARDAERIDLEMGQTAALLLRAMEAAALPVVCLWRRIHTRYHRCTHTFMSAIALAATVIFWLNQ